MKIQLNGLKKSSCQLMAKECMLVLVYCCWEACPGTVRIIDRLDMTSAVYHGRKATNQTIGKMNLFGVIKLFSCSSHLS